MDKKIETNFKELCDVYTMNYDDSIKPFGYGINEIEVSGTLETGLQFDLLLCDVTKYGELPSLNEEQFRIFAKQVSRILKDLNKEKKLKELENK